MKLHYLKKIILPIMLIGIGLKSYSLLIKTSDNIQHKKRALTSVADLYGTWRLKEDTAAWKLVFTSNNKCKQYIEGTLSETDTVIVSTTSPQCGQTVAVDRFSPYLSLQDVTNASNKTCYIFNGLTSTQLSISLIDRAERSVFIKQ